MARAKDDLSKVSINQLETLTGATFRSIKKWLAEKDLEPEETTDNSILYDPREALPIIFEKMGYKMGSSDEIPEMTPEQEAKMAKALIPAIQKARKDRAQADKAEFELEALKGKYVLASEVEQVWADVLTNFRLKAMTFSLSVTPELVKISDPRVLQNRLDQGLKELLKELSEYDGNSDVEEAVWDDEVPDSQGDAEGGTTT